MPRTLAEQIDLGVLQNLALLTTLLSLKRRQSTEEVSNSKKALFQVDLEHKTVCDGPCPKWQKRTCPGGDEHSLLRILRINEELFPCRYLWRNGGLVSVEEGAIGNGYIFLH
jgi:hypothetical protein